MRASKVGATGSGAASNAPARPMILMAERTRSRNTQAQCVVAHPHLRVIWRCFYSLIVKSSKRKIKIVVVVVVVTVTTKLLLLFLLLLLSSDNRLILDLL